MAASTTDKMMKTGASTVTTLSAPGKALAATSLTVGSTTNYPTTTGIVIAIRVVDSAGELVAGTYTEWLATVTSATTLAIDAAPVYGTDQVYAAGSTTQVFIPLSSYAHNRLIDGVLVEHTQAGIHALTSSSTLTSSKFITALNDTNGNELLKVTATGSAVNELTLANAATGNTPSLTASGGDTNIGLNLASKGTGEVQVNGVAMSGAWVSWTPTWTNLTLGNGVVTAYYKQVGKTVFGRIKYSHGSTSSISGSVSFSLPTNSIAGYTSANMGTAYIEDAGAQAYVGFIRLTTVSTATVTVAETSSTYSREATMQATIPFTWGTSDYFSGTFMYEAA